MKKRLFSLFLAIVLVFSMMSTTVLAAGTTDSTATVMQTESTAESDSEAVSNAAPEEAQQTDPETMTAPEETPPEESEGGAPEAQAEGEETGTTPAADAVVYLSVSNKGTLASDNNGNAMANRPVTVKDLDSNGVLSYDEALVAAHAAYNSASGYAATASAYGLSVSKLWGVETSNTLFFVNNAGLENGVGTDTVKAGDKLVASINADNTYYADWYSFFDADAKTVKAGEELTLTLKGHLGMAYTAEDKANTALSGVSVGTWNGGAFTALEGKTTDENGAVTLSFAEAGTYYVTASGTVKDTVTDWTTYATLEADCPIIAPVCVVTVEPAGIASGTCGDDLTWSLSQDGVLTISGTGDMDNTWSLSGAPWKEYKDAIQSVVIESGVTSVGSYAFENYPTIERVSLPDGLTSIGRNAFYSCAALTSVEIPATVTTVGVNTFYKCLGLESVTVNGAMGNYMFYGCTSLKSVTFGDSVTNIGGFVFYGCSGLETLNFPDSLTSVGPYSFVSCSALKSVEIPASVTSVGTYAFQNCGGLESAVVNGTINANAFDSCTGLKNVTFKDSVTTIGNYAFRGCTALENITLPDGLTSIGNHAFNGCTGLVSVEIPGSVTKLGVNIFQNCTSLRDVTLHEGLTSIGASMFNGCTALTSIEIPASVTTLGYNAFQNCTALESVTLTEGLTSIGNYVFSGCTALTSIEIPASVTTLGTYVFQDCTALKNVTLHDGLTSIGNNTFAFCTSLERIAIPGSVEKISGYLFKGCSALKEITTANSNYVVKDNVIYSADGKTLVLCVPAYSGAYEVPADVTELADAAFFYCTGLTDVTLPDGLTRLGEDCFCGCTGLTKVVVPDSVTEIAAYVFQNCTGLAEVKLPAGLTAIGTYMFYGCSSLEGVEIPETVTSIGNYAFFKCAALTALELPDGVTSLGNNAFRGCTSLAEMEIPASVTSLGTYLFYDCSALKAIEVPEGVTTIPVSCFYNCASLESVILPESITKLSSDAFVGADSLDCIYFRGSYDQWEAIPGTKPAILVVCYYGRLGDSADAPVIVHQPKDQVLTQDSDAANALSVKVEAVDEGETLQINWYKNSVESTEGGTRVESTVAEDGVTGYCAPATDTLGKTYYYCMVVKEDAEGWVTITYSDVVSVTVTLNYFSGLGTEAQPYILSTAKDLQTLYDLVAQGENMAGIYFKMVNDITLPEDWKPIGVTIDGSNNIQSGRNLRAFSGTLDGNGNTINIPAGGLPLLGYVRGAEVKNLNIYGEQIAGYGLVNNFEGVGLSGNAIVIDNVTLKSGSSTLKSGLIGANITTNGFAGCSAGFTAVIRNCTIEEGVVIGYDGTQSMIGSIAGRMQGVVENCVSYATVKGVNYVGGIIGTRDNALGTCSVTGCAFHGTVEASGEHAGGIVGGGYGNSTAPNGVRVTINDCASDGTITGANKVGGILGGDTFVAQAWNAYTIKGNSFTGKVSATKGTSVGGIIGFYDSLNKFDDISGNYYVSTCGASKGIGTVVYVDTSCETHETESGALYLNTANGVADCPVVAGCSWRTEHNRTDDPLGADAAKLCYSELDTDPVAVELTVSGEYKAEYITGEALDLTGMILTVTYNNGSTETIALDDVTVTGFDSGKVGEQTLTIAYGSLIARITVRVKNPEGKISVTVSILGDSRHDSDEDGNVHTLAAGNLETWVAAGVYTVDSNATVKDVIEMVLTQNGMTWKNTSGNYIQAVTNGNVKLEEFDNGDYSGWMYTLNGVHSERGVQEQYLKNGDVIIFHYTDDYTKEDYSGTQFADQAAADAVEALIAAIGEVTEDSKEAIEAARAAYDALTDAQKKLVENYKDLTAAERALAELIATEEDRAAAAEVTDAIAAIGKVTLESEEAIQAARKAYDALSSIQKALVGNYDDLVAAEETLAALKAPSGNTENIYGTTGDYLEALAKEYTPTVNSIGGEWLVLGLARSGRTVPSGYYENVVQYVNENINDKEQLHRAKSTDNSRVILALTAAGYDVTDVGGHNLLQGLTDMAYVKKQGINGPIWALIAFDSHNYEIPAGGDVTRESLIAEILNAQLAGGGWAITGSTADPDMTGMALQALAPYYSTNANVKAAVDRALETLSAMQNADGGFSTIGSPTSESSAQVIVALTALGINPNTDPRFIKNGRSVVDALCDYYVEGGGFKHLADGGLNGMASEQGYYALVSYFRLLSGKTSLYDMSDVTIRTNSTEPSNPVNPDAPKTGDEFNVMLWTGLLVTSMLGSAMLLISKKRKYASKYSK